MVHTDKQVATTSNSEIHWQLDIFTQAVRSAPFNYDRYCKSNKFISSIRSATNNSFKEWYIQLVMCRLQLEAKIQAKPRQKKRGQAARMPAFFGLWPGLKFQKAKADGLSPGFSDFC